MPSRILLSLGRRLPIAAAAAVLLLVWPLFAADGVEALLRETHWGEASDSLLHQFGAAVEQLPRPLDFGDSYADIVLRGNTFGGVPMVVFFQWTRRRTASSAFNSSHWAIGSTRPISARWPPRCTPNTA